MENIHTGKVIQNGTSLAIVIPVQILRALKINRGDRLVFAVYDGNSFSCKLMTAEDQRMLKPKERIIEY